MATALVSHPVCAAHEVPPGHPECPARLAAIHDRLYAEGIHDLLLHHDAPRATRTQVLRVHSERLVEDLTRLSPATGLVAIDADTYMGANTLEAAWHAAGAAALATDLVMEGRAENAFCAVRPPGHHAERDRAMGFCLFNNIAVGAAHALDAHRLERIAVLDFDVHHGNGTEDIFAGDARVLVCSTYQHRLYPDKGTAPRSANVVTVPLAPGTAGSEFRSAIRDRWIPVLEHFRPQLIFVSAGFDAHLEDPLSQMMLTDNDYAWLTRKIMALGQRHSSGRIVSSLEGGYALDALGRCVCAHVRVLAGI